MPHVDLDFISGPENYYVILQDQSLTLSDNMVSAFDLQRQDFEWSYQTDPRKVLIIFLAFLVSD